MHRFVFVFFAFVWHVPCACRETVFKWTEREMQRETLWQALHEKIYAKTNAWVQNLHKIVHGKIIAWNTLLRYVGTRICADHMRSLPWKCLADKKVCQFSWCCEHLLRAMLVNSCWNVETVLHWTTWRGKALYTCTRWKRERQYKSGCCNRCVLKPVISHIFVPGRCGKKSVICGWAWGKCVLCKNPSIAMSRLKLSGARL